MKTEGWFLFKNFKLMKEILFFLNVWVRFEESWQSQYSVAVYSCSTSLCPADISPRGELKKKKAVSVDTVCSLPG